ncbi:hypothetical protein B0T22DRAFT_376282 [Podospora appendiculata]|uniref:RRM domain-containing protein n=1 Tax=Podospora appendiculata TaxID=314037 RepID=A0AAE0XCP8_9PEZI|nr:hypothetical protein B0T22DRAFT_376282 [Podospora appendiculata]
MEPALGQHPTDALDSLVAGGDYSDNTAEESDGSFDAYAEDDEGQEQKNEPDTANDDYARTFDSPADREQDQDLREADEEAQPDVSKASESMNSSSAPDSPAMKSQSPDLPASVLSSPSPGLPLTNGSALDQPQDHDRGSSAPAETEPASSNPVPRVPAETLPAAPTAHPSDAPITSTSTSVDMTDARAPTPSSIRAPDVAPDSASDIASATEDDAAIDIQKLVDDITARASATDPSSPMLPTPPVQATPAASQAAPAVVGVSHSASLPPKPSVSQQPGHLPAIPQTLPFPSRAPNTLVSPTAPMPNANPATPHGTYLSMGAPGTISEAIASLPPPPVTAAHMSIPADASVPSRHPPSSQQAWELFQSDEKRYTSEAKWERFPNNSRIFIGNLSSERVSKREVFDLFHKFGRLAQISLKNAYGFVQYHTVEEGQIAMHNAQGVELGGRKIHLEFSRPQKAKNEERERSPDRRHQRGGRSIDRYNGREPSREPVRELGWRRDDYRPGRSPSPRRSDARGSRDGFFPRDREPSSSTFGRRSRSPPRYGRANGDSYRQRSPSPRRRAPSDGDRLDIPRRYGAAVPDVQMLLRGEVSRDFVAWVQHAFHERGLKTDVMFLSPRFPREALVQRQVLEGVHAIIDLELTAQTKNKIPVQIFKRSGGASAQFELYQDLDPATAAALVEREKSQSAPQLIQSGPVYPTNNYAHPYPTGPSNGYPYQYPQAASQAPPPAHPQPLGGMPDVANWVGQLDNTGLQALLASLQTSQGVITNQGSHPSMSGNFQPPGAPQAAQIDINTLLGNLRNGAAAHTPMTGITYGSAQAYGQNGAAMPGIHNAPVGMAGYGGADTAQQVQTIIDQLKRATQ